jgi:putative ABC transport system permease protein
MNDLVISNIRQRPLRTLISVAGVALGVCLVMLFTGLSRGMSSELQRRASSVRAEIMFARSGGSVQLSVAGATANLSTAYVGELKKIDGVADAVPVLVHIMQGGRGFGFERVEGTDWEAYAAMNELRLVRGAPPRGEREIVVDEKKARDNNLDVGSTLKLFNDTPYRIAGIYAPESSARIKMPLEAAQAELEAAGKCTLILVKCRDGIAPEEIARRINAELPGNKIQFTRELADMSFERSIPFLGTFLRVLVGLSAIVSALVIMLAMYTTITERTREIGTLKALGASRKSIVMTIEKEALVISLVGLVVGFIVALITGAVIQRAYGLSFEYGWGWALAACLIGLGGAALGALYPAIRAASLDPVEALAYE